MLRYLPSQNEARTHPLPKTVLAACCSECTVQPKGQISQGKELVSRQYQRTAPLSLGSLQLPILPAHGTANQPGDSSPPILGANRAANIAGPWFYLGLLAAK